MLSIHFKKKIQLKKIKTKQINNNKKQSIKQTNKHVFVTRYPKFKQLNIFISIFYYSGHTFYLNKFLFSDKGYKTGPDNFGEKNQYWYSQIDS